MYKAKYSLLQRFMVDRIRQLMEYKGFTSTQLADNIEVPRAVVSHILSGRNKPSLDVVLKIISSYREIAVNWLLLGEGDMLNGLASESKSERAFPPSEKELPKENPVISDEQAPIEKVQEPTPVVKAPSSDNKAIEQVMIFYTDKTFMAYKPTL